MTSHTFIIIVHKWWWIIVGLPPKLDLIVSIFDCCFLLTEALQGSIVPLVNPPGLDSFCVIAETHCLEKERTCLGSSDEHRGVSHIKVETSFLKEITSFSSFLFSSLVEWNIDPAAELS